MPFIDDFTRNKEEDGFISRRMWNLNHQACPDCNNTQLMVTLMGCIEFDDRDYEDNFNTAKCKCGWRGPVRDLLPPIKKD